MMFTDTEWDWIEKAVLLARDAAFISTGDKASAPVKQWDELRERVKVVRQIQTDA